MEKNNFRLNTAVCIAQMNVVQYGSIGLYDDNNYFFMRNENTYV